MPDWDAHALTIVYGGAHGAFGPLMIALSVVGGGWALVLLLPLVALARTRRFAGVLAAGVAAQAVLVWALKAAVGRVRPWIRFDLAAPLGAPHDGSFPSGHAAGCFCVAAFLAVVLPAEWPDRPRLGRTVVGLAAIFAASVALSRVYLGAHFPSDVVAGAVLGALVGHGAGLAYVAPKDGWAARGVRVEAPPKRR
jgi:undecaprenyl-diphosphatase